MAENYTEKLWKRNLKRFVNNRLALFGLIVFSTITIMSIFAPIFTSYDPGGIDYDSFLQAPSMNHLFGTDELGRDIFARILYGGRVSIAVGIVSSVISGAIGIIFGALAGYFGGKVDTILVRLSEILLTLPNMIMILVLSAILGPSVGNIILVLSIRGWMTTFRMVRNRFMSLKEEVYVEASRSFGFSDWRIIFGDLLPNTLSPVVVSFSMNVAAFILTEASLSFLGLGVPTGTPTWGNIINSAKSINIIQNSWWVWLIPGMVISLFTLSTNFIGDGLRDAMDAKQQ
ncbi:peptide/nickel transport system permease protein [Streptococcus rupicaprae]|uniref:Peptide/nickel transport system permease protein n=1 Tax=Streptococcus rupicaprae TaxID=759619 RepID=A0ABV2FGG6_9STRE